MAKNDDLIIEGKIVMNERCIGDLFFEESW